MRFQWNAKGTALYVEAIVNEVQSVWRVEVDPKTLRWLSAERLTTGGADANAAVSQDGMRLAFTTEQHASRLWAFPLNAAMSAITGHGTPLTPEDGVVERSDLSPDGSRVAYVIKQPGSRQSDLWSINIDGSRRELLAQNVVDARWSPDSKAIAYTLFRVDREEWALGIRAIAGPERLLSPWSHESAMLPTDWAPDGSAILGAYMSPVSSPAVLALWPTSNPASKPQRVLFALKDANLWQGRFSSDARWIAFIVDRRGGTQVELVVAPAVGPLAEWTRVAPDHVLTDKPRWAPDGRTLYFLSRRHIDEPINLWGARFDPERGVAGTPFMVTHFDSPGQLISPNVGSTGDGCRTTMGGSHNGGSHGQYLDSRPRGQVRL